LGFCSWKAKLIGSKCGVVAYRFFLTFDCITPTNLFRNFEELDFYRIIWQG